MKHYAWNAEKNAQIKKVRGVSFEKERLEAFETGNLKRVSRVKTEIKQHRQYAAATLKKNTQINVEKSLEGMKF